jgi:tryptophanyl-tRNA synthetase
VCEKHSALVYERKTLYNFPINKESKMSAQKTSQQIRFEKEAKALQKNIAKRKKQQQELERIKKEKEQQRGQD